jgi:small subunit ribosomal protein S18
VCQFCVDKTAYIDYKDVNKLRRYLSERARIEPRRTTGTCARHQRRLSVAIKRARILALLPYTPEQMKTLGFTRPEGGYRGGGGRYQRSDGGGGRFQRTEGGGYRPAGPRPYSGPPSDRPAEQSAPGDTAGAAAADTSTETSAPQSGEPQEPA